LSKAETTPYSVGGRNLKQNFCVILRLGRMSQSYVLG
jgi:hypothetical protein